MAPQASEKNLLTETKTLRPQKTQIKKNLLCLCVKFFRSSEIQNRSKPEASIQTRWLKSIRILTFLSILLSKESLLETTKLLRIYR